MQQCSESSSSSIGNRQEALAIENKQDESGDDENKEEEEEEQEESEEEEVEKARLQAATSPIDTTQEKAKAAASLLNRLIMKANQVKLNTTRTKSNRAVMLAIAENIKEVEATRRVLCRLSGAKKAHFSHTRTTHTHHTHVSYTRIIHTHHTHVSYTRIIHTHHTHASYTRIAKNFHAQVSNTHKMKMHHMR